MSMLDDHPPPASLNDLTRHIEIQNQAIKSLPPGVIAPLVSEAPWEDFRQEFWKKPLTSLETPETIDRGEDPVEDNVFPEGPPSGSFPVIVAPKSFSNALGLASRKIVVRSEYDEAEQMAVLSVKSGVRLFVATGTPGIGKSMFLLRLLMRRFMLQLPTVFQPGTNNPILFHKNGTYELKKFRNPEWYKALAFPENPSCRIWALFDPSPDAPQPAALLTSTSSPFFIVQAASPRSDYNDWHNKLGPRYFYMKPWSFLELVQVRQFFLFSNPTERQLWYLYDKFGASLRELINFVARPIEYEARLLFEIDQLDSAKIRAMFRDPRSHSASYLILTLHPMEGYRFRFSAAPASLHVFDLLLKKHLQFNIDDMEHFYNLFVGSATGTTAAGLIFELRMHTILPEIRTIRLFPIHCVDPKKGTVNFIYDDHEATKGRTNEQKFELPELRSDSLGKKTELQANTYYTPDSATFPTFDSLLFFTPLGDSPPILLMLQMTRAQKHDAKVTGLDYVAKFENVRKYYVAVTPDDVFTKISIPKVHFVGKKAKDMMASPNEVFPVFHFPVSKQVLFPKRGHFLSAEGGTVMQ